MLYKAVHVVQKNNMGRSRDQSLCMTGKLFSGFWSKVIGKKIVDSQTKSFCNLPNIGEKVEEENSGHLLQNNTNTMVNMNQKCKAVLFRKTFEDLRHQYLSHSFDKWKWMEHVGIGLVGSVIVDKFEIQLFSSIQGNEFKLSILQKTCEGEH